MNAVISIGVLCAKSKVASILLKVTHAPQYPIPSSYHQLMHTQRHRWLLIIWCSFCDDSFPWYLPPVFGAFSLYVTILDWYGINNYQ